MGRAQDLARKPVTWVVAVVVVGVIGVGLALTEPWTLFTDETVDEPFPVVAADVTTTTTAPPPTTAAPGGAAVDGTTTTTAPPTTTAAPQPVTLSTGDFISKDHGTSGRALVVELPDGTRHLRIEDLDTDNGPDLFVYLSAAAPEASNGEIEGAAFVDLGGLKGNIGNQNYEIPPDVDLSGYSSVVVWCRRFSSAFGAAPLTVG